MVFVANDPLEPPIEASAWRNGKSSSVSWKTSEDWHFIAGDCVEKPEHVSAGEQEYRAHADYGINIVITGTGYYRDWWGTRHPLGPGVVYQRIVGKSHALEIDPDCHWCEAYLTIRSSTVKHLLGLGLIDECPVYYLRHPELINNQFRDLLLALAQTHTKQVPRILVQVQQLLIDIHADAQSDGDPDPHRHLIADACTILDCHLDRDLDMEALAQDVGMAYETFRKAFKERKGIAPGAYRVRKRIERSCVLLRSTQQPINVIAEQLGYSDGFSFSAQFKKIIGMSPSAYRLVKS